MCLTLQTKCSLYGHDSWLQYTSLSISLELCHFHLYLSFSCYFSVTYPNCTPFSLATARVGDQIVSWYHSRRNVLGSVSILHCGTGSWPRVVLQILQKTKINRSCVATWRNAVYPCSILYTCCFPWAFYFVCSYIRVAFQQYIEK